MGDPNDLISYKVENLEVDVEKMKEKVEEHDNKFISLDVIIPNLIDIIGELKTFIKDNSETMIQMKYQMEKTNTQVESLKKDVDSALNDSKKANNRGKFDVIEYITKNLPSIIIAIYLLLQVIPK